MSTILQAKDVCKYFRGLKAVDGVSMEVQKGEIFGIIGPNGAGKTTFFNVCSGVYEATAGQVFLDGEEITGRPPEEIARKGMARTFQNIQLFKYMTVLENVKIGNHIHSKTNMFDAIFHTGRYKQDEKEALERAEAVIEKVGIAEYRDVMAGTLSYGSQRKVEIARALALEPKILLLDEPAAGMNPNETQELSDFIKRINAEGYTIVVIEHDMKFIMNLCHRILVINFGKRICEGTPDEVRSNRQVHEAYFGKGTLGGVHVDKEHEAVREEASEDAED